MGRKSKTTAEFFSHNCKQGKVAYIMQREWGNDGYAAFFKIYERLGDSEGQFIDCKVNGEWDYLVSYLMIPAETVHAMISKLVEIGQIDRDLWYKGMVLWSQSFVDDLEELYKKRKGGPPAKPDLCQHKTRLESISAPEISGKEDIRVGNTQSRVEYSKDLKTKDLKKADGEGKPPAPYGEGKALLSLKNLFEFDDVATRAYLDTVCDRLYRSKIFPQAEAFKNKYLKMKYNPRAILHALIRCSVHARDDPWGYCTKIIRTENGNYNERAFIQEAAANHVSREDAAETLRAIFDFEF